MSILLFTQFILTPMSRALLQQWLSSCSIGSDMDWWVTHNSLFMSPSGFRPVCPLFHMLARNLANSLTGFTQPSAYPPKLVKPHALSGGKCGRRRRDSRQGRCCLQFTRFFHLLIAAVLRQQQQWLGSSNISSNMDWWVTLYPFIAPYVTPQDFVLFVLFSICRLGIKQIHSLGLLNHLQILLN